MVSLRNFFSICIMMVVLLCMFQFFLLFKERGNKYDINEYAEEVALSGVDQWKPDRQEDAPVILFLGKEQNGISDVVHQWCLYTKHGLVSMDSLEETERWQELKEAEMILIDGSVLQLPEQEEALLELMELGITTVFLRLPEAEKLEACTKLQKVLGIAEVQAASVETEGLQMYSGFFLGGEALYKITENMNPEQQKLQDMELTMPWYRLGVGTKVYMTGLLNEDEVEREYFPPVIWRNSYQGILVFAVNGDYMTTLTGLGILDAFCYEKQDYYLYPVINARNITVAGFPCFANENAERMMQQYSRSLSALQEDVMWPDLYALSSKIRQKFTFCCMPQYDYGDAVQPSGGNVAFFQRQIKEIGGEVGLTLEYTGNITLSDKLSADRVFWKQNGGRYCFLAYYAGEELDKEERTQIDMGSLAGVRTVVTDYHPGEYLVFYYNNEVTVQGITGYADQYSYSFDMQRRSLDTALGYHNLLLDLKPVLWSSSQDEQWENYYDRISSNITTYRYTEKMFESTTLTQSDSRVRNFLNLSYSQNRLADTISLEIEGGMEAWFILRTHGEAVSGISGGEYHVLEKDVYLIHAVDSNIEIQLKKETEPAQFYFS